ncbi:glycosyltransferase family 25 protein [Hymenobacter sp. PAMC 26628]|uniref:glycosyltransferase family 25 protein n=1 Tax=Hymenobacter sp. PAMC 26628 TaxID=1484118 RepID=UPI00090203D1|nr:glycosyltransferase family 25 protein [Hymenobacter sp. PAMC 26628]
MTTGISKLISSLVFNAFAHYNFSNRIEYVKLRLRWYIPPELERVVEESIYIRQTFVLSLKNSLDRRSFIKKGFDGEKLHYSIVDGLMGVDVCKYPNIISVRSVAFLSEGSVGCWLGHYSVWKRIVSQKIEYSMIFEDDVILAKSFNTKLNSVLENVPNDFDILFLNSGNNYSHNKRVIINKRIFIPYQIRNGAYGYIVSYSGVKKLLNMIPSVQVTRGGIDSAIGSLIRDKRILAYHLDEPLCWVDYSFSSSIKLK